MFIVLGMFNFADSDIILPSNWNINNMFALSGELGQVHMAKRNIFDFPPCAKIFLLDHFSPLFLSQKL